MFPADLHIPFLDRGRGSPHSFFLREKTYKEEDLRDIFVASETFHAFAIKLLGGTSGMQSVCIAIFAEKGFIVIQPSHSPVLPK